MADSLKTVMSEKIPCGRKNVFCVISGGNIDRGKPDGIPAEKPQDHNQAPQTPQP